MKLFTLLICMSVNTLWCMEEFPISPEFKQSDVRSIEQHELPDTIEYRAILNNGDQVTAMISGIQGFRCSFPSNFLISVIRTAHPRYSPAKRSIDLAPHYFFFLKHVYQEQLNARQ